MRICLFILGVILLSCQAKQESVRMSLKEKYLLFDAPYSDREAFNDSICQVATDSTSRRFKKNKFELFAFLWGDTSHTPIHLLQDSFRLHVIGFSEKDIVFRFCFNESMISEFEKKYKFNPIDSVRVLYDSLANIGLTDVPQKFGMFDDDLEKYIFCKLDFPDGFVLDPPYPLVRVRFRISPSGKPDSIRIIESFSAEYDHAVLDLITNMPRWRPRRGEDGKYAPVYYEYPVRFDLDEREKYCY